MLVKISELNVTTVRMLYRVKDRHWLYHIIIKCFPLMFILAQVLSLLLAFYLKLGTSFLLLIWAPGRRVNQKNLMALNLWLLLWKRGCGCSSWNNNQVTIFVPYPTWHNRPHSSPLLMMVLGFYFSQIEIGQFFFFFSWTRKLNVLPHKGN